MRVVLAVVFAACVLASGCRWLPVHNDTTATRLTTTRAECGVAIINDPHERMPRPAAVEYWMPCLSLFDWPVAEAAAVLACESNGDSDRPNDEGSDAWGLFQIKADDLAGSNVVIPYRALGLDWPLTFAQARRWLQSPANNLRAAYLRWQFDGWTGWACQPR